MRICVVRYGTRVRDVLNAIKGGGGDKSDERKQ